MAIKKKHIFRILAGALAASMLLTACGKSSGVSNVYEYGDLEDASEEEASSEEDDGTESEATLPTYDAQNATQPLSYASDRTIETKASYYKEQLDARPRRAFDAIYNAAENMYESVELESSQLVTPAELENIMHIIFLDCPELFWLEPEFSYSTNSDGYASKVSLYYSMGAEAIQKQKDDLATKKPNILSYVKNNDYYSIGKIMSAINTNVPSLISVSQNMDGTLDESCNDAFSSTVSKGSVGQAKYIMYWLRQCGIDCTVVMGEPVSATLTDAGYELTTDWMQFRTASQGEDGSVTIRYAYSCYWVWNVVKIDDKWYNLDYFYSILLNTVADSSYGKDSLWFVPDILMSQTRLYYMNEEYLGISPSCTDVNFMTSYREGWYVLSLTETQALKKLQGVIASIDAANSSSYTMQCEDESTFNYLADNLEEQFSNYNSANGEPIGSYKYYADRDSLVITIYDLIHNTR